jgi:N-acetylneuraminic acid mutarotase
MPYRLISRCPILVLGTLVSFGLAGCQDGSTPSEPEAAVPARPNGILVAEPSPNTWRTVASIPTGRFFLAAATVNGIVYAIGGRDASGALRTVEAYDPATDILLGVPWHSKAPMPARRASPSGAAVINGKIYVPGGRNAADSLTKSLFVYTPATNQWATKAAMPVLSANGGAGAINGKLYVYTPARNGKGPYLHRYDPSTNAWTQRAAPPHGSAFPATGVIDGKFYLAGGLDGGLYSANLDVYNPATNTWTTKKPMPAARGFAAGRVLNGKLYVIGGSITSGTVGRVERYDPASNTWVARANMPTARFHLAAAAANGNLYALGGLGPPNTLSLNQAYTP